MNNKIKMLSIILAIAVLLTFGAEKLIKMFKDKGQEPPAQQAGQMTQYPHEPFNPADVAPQEDPNNAPAQGQQQRTPAMYDEKLKEVIDTQYRLFLGLRSYKEPPHDPAVKVIPSSIIGKYPPPFYRTLIVDFKNIDKPVIETQDLFLFKNGELWNVGVVRTLFDQKWMEDLVFAAPMSQEPMLQKPEFNRMRISNGTDTTLINYVTKDLMSIAFSTEGTDPGLMNSWAYGKLAVLPVENISNLYEYNILFSDIFGEEGTKIMLEESNKAYLRSRNSDRLLQYADVANWGLVHTQGELILIGRLDYNAEVGRGYFEDFKIPIDISGLFHNTTSYPSWDVIKEKVPDAVDAVSSPDRKVLVVLTNNDAIFYKIVNERTWNEILRYPLKESEAIVMCEWERNTEELQNLLTAFSAAKWHERLIHYYYPVNYDEGGNAANY
ncbi:MAG TPA: hypothetical protein GX395_01590 [Clostridia bacterium]|jgi:hypothetical protein|nr:hypothetical protein [Clostridia bacterium]